jgi:hypothetical protein
MKKIILIILILTIKMSAFAQQTVDLNGVTFGFAAGYKTNLDKTYEYSLSPEQALKIQPLNKQSFVISSVFTIKLGKLATDPQSNALVKQSSKHVYYNAKMEYEEKLLSVNKKITRLKNNVSLLNSKADGEAIAAIKKEIESEENELNLLQKNLYKSTGLTFLDRLSFNVGMDMVNIDKNVSFNKSINGGLGLGYFITPEIQAAVFYDIMGIRQLQDYVVEKYKDAPIPKAGGTFYNALDVEDNNLYYNKTIKSLSFKLIFSLGNKKEN